MYMHYYCFFLMVFIVYLHQGTTFGTAGDLFKNTIGKLGNMLTTSSSYHMYYLVAFVVFIFLVLYFMMGRK